MLLFSALLLSNATYDTEFLIKIKYLIKKTMLFLPILPMLFLVYTSTKIICWCMNCLLWCQKKKSLLLLYVCSILCYWLLLYTSWYQTAAARLFTSELDWHQLPCLTHINGWFKFITFQCWAAAVAVHSTERCFIYTLGSSNSSSYTFWSSKSPSSSRSNWNGIWTGNSNRSWTDKQSSHFSTAKEISVNAIFFFMSKS